MSKSKGIKRPEHELAFKARNQLEHLMDSCRAYDNGTIREAERIALAVRVLAHNTNHSLSVAKQLGVTAKQFFSTSFVEPGINYIPYMGLCTLRIGGDLTTGLFHAFLPILNMGKNNRWIGFDTWWNETALDDRRGGKLSRGDVILCVADNDGGAHLDDHLPQKYAAISRLNSLRVESAGDSVSIEFSVPPAAATIDPPLDPHFDPFSLKNPVYATVRQIGYEIQKTFHHHAPFLYAQPNQVYP